MGSWSVTINGNDFVNDIKDEYPIIFAKYSPKEGFNIIEKYVREQTYSNNEFLDQNYKGFIYSVAKYMWKNGILTDEVKNKTVEIIDNDSFDEYEGNEKLISKRKKILEDLRKTLLSPQCEAKKFKLKKTIYPVFKIGDIIQVKLGNGKYVYFQKILENVSNDSRIDASVCSYDSVYVLFDYIDKMAWRFKKKLELKMCQCYYYHNALSKTVKEVDIPLTFNIYENDMVYIMKRHQFEVIENNDVYYSLDKNDWRRYYGEVNYIDIDDFENNVISFLSLTTLDKR